VQERDSRASKVDEAALELNQPIRTSFLERQGLWAWFLGGAILIAAVAGLVVVALMYSRTGETTLGIWVHNQPTLMVVLVLTNLLFIGYAAYQQHMIMAARKRRQHRRLLAILTVSRIMGAETNLQSILDSITDVCRKTYLCDQVSLSRLDHETQILNVCSASGHKDLTRVLGSSQKIGHGITGWVAERQEPLILGPQINKKQFKEFEAKVHNISAAMVVPIILRDELFGVLSVSSRSKKIRYDEEDLEALQVFAETTGICCRHSEQTNWMRQTIQRMDKELTEKDRMNRAA
jgi:transcriptional regulator with GAF, ATPase, and Fis domain